MGEFTRKQSDDTLRQRTSSPTETSDLGKRTLTEQRSEGVGKRTLTEQLPPTNSAWAGAAPAKTATKLSTGDEVLSERPLDKAIKTGWRGVEMLRLVRVLFPAYRRAIDALDPGAALELARNVVGAFEVARVARLEVLATAPDDDPHRFMTSVPGQPDDGEQSIRTKSAELNALKVRLSDLPVTETELAQKIGPQTFRDASVLGAYVVPSFGADVVGYLANEAGGAVELVAAVTQIRTLAGAEGATCPALTAAQRQEIVRLVEPWKGRPVNFAFLTRALTELGIWDAVAADKGATGRSLEETRRAVSAQVHETGALADVGELDTETLQRMLGQVDSDDGAMAIFEKIRDAAPSARGPLLSQIDRLGKLDAFCQHLPFVYVKELHDAVASFDPASARLLVPFFEGKGGARSMRQIYMDQVDQNLEEDQILRAFGWFFLERLHNTFTFGFQNEYSDAFEAHQVGLITLGQFVSSATKALGKAAVIAAASAATGGVAGELGQGVAAGLGASRSVAQIIGGGVGGVASGVGGHLGGDIYDQLLNGKQGFDPASAYVQSGAIGGAMGAGLAGISIAGGRYLHGSAQRTVDLYAQRFPLMAHALESIRMSGFRSGATVRLKVGQLIEMVGSGFGGPNGAAELAYAGAYGDLRALPPETILLVKVRPAPGLKQLMRRGDDESGLLEIESIDRESGSLFDDYGNEASYADDVHEFRAEDGPNPRSHDVEDISVARPERGGQLSRRRERHVAGRRMAPEMEAENGMSVLDEARLDLTRPPRHHTLPQEHIKFFQDRGFYGREIDRFTVQLDKLEHEVVHGGNQALARKHWKGREWNTELMSRLNAEEAILRSQQGPQAKVSRRTILKIMEQLRVDFRIHQQPYVHYRAPDGP